MSTDSTCLTNPKHTEKEYCICISRGSPEKENKEITISIMHTYREKEVYYKELTNVIMGVDKCQDPPVSQ